MTTETDPKTDALITYDYGEDKGAGFSSMSSKDYRIPLLNVLQSQSKATIEGETLYVEGAKAGMFHNNVTNAVYDGKQGILLIAVDRKLVYIERKDDSARTFVGKHAETSDIVRQAVAANGGSDFGLKTREGNKLIPVFELYCIEVMNPSGQQGDLVVGKGIIVPFSSKKIKPYQTMNSTLDGLPGDPPLYAFLLRATTFPDKNDKGNFYNIKMLPALGTAKASMLDPASTLFQGAKAFAKLVKTGTLKVADDAHLDPEEATAF